MNLKKNLFRRLAVLAFSALPLLSCSAPNPESTGFNNISVSIPKKEPERFAVIINQADEEVFMRETEEIYDVLRQLGYDQRRIYVLGHEHGGSFSHPIHAKATKDNVKRLFNDLIDCIDEDDTLLMHLMGHAGYRWYWPKNSPSGNIERVTIVEFEDGVLDENYFNDIFSRISPEFGLITTDVCYGGGLTERIGGDRFIAVSQTTGSRKGYILPDDTFGGHFYRAYLTREADRNNDGIVSVMEALEYAEEKHSSPRGVPINPQIVSDLDPSDYSIDF